MIAVSMLIFKDSILGFVAGIQLSANQMVRVGDWVEIPQYGADGDVCLSEDGHRMLEPGQRLLGRAHGKEETRSWQTRDCVAGMGSGPCG